MLDSVEALSPIIPLRGCGEDELDKESASEDAAGAGGIILAMILRPVCAPDVVVPPDANEGAMKVAEDAVALARDANEEAAALRESVGAWYFVALLLTAAVPVVVAFLLFPVLVSSPA